MCVALDFIGRTVLQNDNVNLSRDVKGMLHMQ